VINAFPNPTARRLVEDEIVKALKDRKIDAVVSYTIMPDPVVSDTDAIEAKAKEVGADTVLINKRLGTTGGETYGAGGVIYKDVYIDTQIDVYDMKSNRVVLRVSADTWIQQDAPNVKLIQSYVKDLVNRLSRQGLF
jgi:hypothetical protein